MVPLGWMQMGSDARMGARTGAGQAGDIITSVILTNTRAQLSIFTIVAMYSETGGVKSLKNTYYYIMFL